MKRKIAVLLSAMMVASAMPITASAVELKSDSVVNAGFGKVGSTIDAKAEEYTKYKTSEELQSRETVLKLTLENNKTDNIKVSEGSFKVVLNGTFGDLKAGDDASKSSFAYKNVALAETDIFDNPNKDGEKYILKQNILAKASPQASNTSANPGSGATYPVPEGAVRVENGVVKGIMHNGKLEPIKHQWEVNTLNKILVVLKGVSDGTDATKGQVASGAASAMQKLFSDSEQWTALDEIKAEFGKVLDAHFADPASAVEVLPNIPYNIEIVSPTEAKVTIKNEITNDMVDKDSYTFKRVKPKADGLSFAASGRLSMEVYKGGEGLGTDKVALAQNGNEVKAIADGTSSGYLTLCGRSDNEEVSQNLLQDAGKDVTSKGKAYLALPLGAVKVVGDGVVKVKVETDGSTKVIGGEYTLTKANGEGSTNTGDTSTPTETAETKLNETVKVTVGEKTVVVGSQKLEMDAAPYIQATSNSTMVPLRFVAVALGVDSENVANPDASSKVSWDQNSKTVTINYGAGATKKTIQFQADSNTMTFDGNKIAMDNGVKAELKDGVIFVPFRALGQALGVSVSWNQETKTATYNEQTESTNK